MIKNCYIDIHVLQTVPPCCINRDDTGSPKTARYGGVTRARVSSQSWKRAVRLDFNACMDESLQGKRTKYVRELIFGAMYEQDAERAVDAESKIDEVMSSYGLGKPDASGKLSALFFIGNTQIKALAKAILDQKDVPEKATGKTDEAKKANAERQHIIDNNKQMILDALKEHPSADQALFGRMVADNPSLNYDAAAQVAHAISTHAVQNEFDYFTAVDDCSKEDSQGASHIGTVEFNSATLYRYATVNISELASNLGDEAAAVACDFVRSFICTMPTGKQSTFANRTSPDFVYVTIRNDQPVNLVNAFEKPVVAGNNGYIENSEKRLVDYAHKVYQCFADKPVKAYVVGGYFDDDTEEINLKDLLNQLGNAINEVI